MNTQNYIDEWIKKNLFDSAPVGIAVIDKEFNVVHANQAFGSMFGRWQKRKCYSVYKNREKLCDACNGAKALEDGLPRSNAEVGYSKEGRLTHYMKHTLPVVNELGEIAFLVEIAIDTSETEKVKKQNQLLFDQVPCNILIINRDFKIVKTNEVLRKQFGNLEGQYCYAALKGFDQRCLECTAHKTFTDGQKHTGPSLVKDKSGKPIQFLVNTVPLDTDQDQVELVMETAVDITQTLQLEEKLEIAHGFMSSIIETSVDGIIAVDQNHEITIINSAARAILHISESQMIDIDQLEYMLPEGFINQVEAGSAHVFLPETEITTLKDEAVPVRLTGVQLRVGNKYMGMTFSIQDLSEIKRLEGDKLEAERMAAVGQTVAGLAHGVKNLITGLEGGMYMLNSGISKNKAERVHQGIEMLNRNIERVSTFVKEFLSFSKGRKIRVNYNYPPKIAKEVVELYHAKAQEKGIDLIFEPIGTVEEAPLDYESIHECLTNLVGNAIDACSMSDKGRKCHVWVRIFEEDQTIIYEVADDGCGMDYMLKRKVFTTFFTTKGLGGTGLGLLITKKIIQEHGGSIKVDSTPGEGTTFRIRLPRQRLPEPITDEPDSSPEDS